MIVSTMLIIPTAISCLSCAAFVLPPPCWILPLLRWIVPFWSPMVLVPIAGIDLACIELPMLFGLAGITISIAMCPAICVFCLACYCCEQTACAPIGAQAQARARIAEERARAISAQAAQPS